MAFVQGQVQLKQKFTALLAEKSEHRGRKERGWKPKLLHMKLTPISNWPLVPTDRAGSKQISAAAITEKTKLGV